MTELIELLAKVYLGVAIIDVLRTAITCIKRHEEIKNGFRKEVQDQLYLKAGLHYEWTNSTYNFIADVIMIVTACLFVILNGLAWPKQVLNTINDKTKES